MPYTRITGGAAQPPRIHMRSTLLHCKFVSDRTSVLCRVAHFGARPCPCPVRSAKKRPVADWIIILKGVSEMPGQSVLVQISIIYCMIHMYVFLFLFYEYRCSKPTFIISGATVILVTSGICLWILFTRGVAVMGQYGVLIASIPSLSFFFVMSKHRNAQFVFAFCLSDTVCMWIELASALIDYAVGGGGVVTFALRLISIPLLEYAVYRWLRKPYLEMSHLIRKGWLLFAALTGIIYLILVLLCVYPTIILERPQDMPLAVMVLVLIALVYGTIFLVLFEQLHNLEAQERQRVLEAQTVMMCQRVEDILRAEETMRIERHDMRHQLQTVASLAQRGDCAALLDYIGSSQEKLAAANPKRYCSHPALDAVLVNAAAQAEQMNISMEIKVALPKELPVDAFELSIVFANALENAIQAVKELPVDQRRIICKSVTRPRFMVEISNSYAGKVTFDQRGVPVTNKPGHGIGTRSIVAFAEKHNALYRFQAENGWFKLQIAM